MITIDLPQPIEQELRNALAALAGRGELLSRDQLNAAYSGFRERFGPEKLSLLDGKTLLELMHAHGSKDTMVYWLEFKDDEEFPGRKFGSIAGGSALKFRLFRRAGTDQWVDGSGNDITVDQAIALALENRKQLLSCVDLLKRLPIGADDQTYLELQDNIEKQAPSIANLGWAHKYLHMIFPDKLDDYHSQSWQRHNLIKILQTPPATTGLYAGAGRFVNLAAQFEWPVTHLTIALGERNGPPNQYWRIGTKLGEGSGAEDVWPAMSQGGYAAIGWEDAGDLSALGSGKELREGIQALLAEHYYGDDARTASRKAGEMKNFVENIKEGDVVLASAGAQVVGIGKVTGPYYYSATPPTGAPNRRPVRWFSFGEQQLPRIHDGPRTTVYKASDEAMFLEVERLLQSGSAQAIAPPDTTSPEEPLEGIPGRIQRILERKGQVILYGPPGTGKTYWARHAARELAARFAFKKAYGRLTTDEKLEVDGGTTHDGLVRCCTFHPAYGYEDFIEGFRPATSQTGQLVFESRKGIFKKLCEDAWANRERHFFLLVDEINRGDIPRVFGELLTLLEWDKRGMTLNLPVSGERFSVPPNLRLIGTMNTADRSIALLDTALRRRFGFVELMPDIGVFGHASLDQALPLGLWLAALNERVRTHLGRDARNLQIGHAYLLENGQAVTDWEKFVRILAEDIIPLLEEYCYEDYSALVKILGTGLVDESRQRIRDELFASGRREDLIQALLSTAPEIMTSGTVPAVSDDSDEPEPELEEIDA